jgi:hypothetical protein
MLHIIKNKVFPNNQNNPKNHSSDSHSSDKWLRLAPFFVLSVVFGIITMFSHASTGGGILSGQETYPLWQRIIFGSYALVEYITKFLAPYNLLYLYPFPMRVGEAMPAWLPVYPAIVLTIVAALWKYLSKGVMAAGLTFFMIHIALMLHVVPMSRFAVLADRYIYLASIGLTFIAAYYFVSITNYKLRITPNPCSGSKTLQAVEMQTNHLQGSKTTARVVRTARVRILLAGLLVVTCLGVYSNLRCRDWKNTDSIKKELRELLKQRKDYVPERIKN